MRCFALLTVMALCFPVGCGDDEGGGRPASFEDTGLAAGLLGCDSSFLGLGDCDNDGDLDLAITGYVTETGEGITRIYESQGGAFPGSELATGLTRVWGGSAVWGDADNDGDLDLAIAGRTVPAMPFAPVTKVYENFGGGFDGTELAAGVTEVGDCSLAWGDADNDGDLDLAVAGDTGAIGGGNYTKVYENDGAGGFTEFPGLSLTVVRYSSIAWGDCDNDGDLDLAVAGEAYGWYSTTIYENNGAGGFTEFPGLNLTGVRFCSIAWGDCDNDGDLDLAVAGETDASPLTTVYENVDGTFDGRKLATGLTGVYWCSLAWGDADNDGDLDLAVGGVTAGFDPAGYTLKIYENRGGAFDGTELVSGLTGIRGCSLAWGDLDSDGDLDLVVTGLTAEGTRTIIYRNNCPIVNTRPGAPTGLVAFPSGAETVLTWAESLDQETPAEGLSYNVEVWRTPGGQIVAPGMAAEDGWRRVPALGPIRPTASYPACVLKGLLPGVYVFSVQAIDSALEGSPWSAPVPFTVP